MTYRGMSNTTGGAITDRDHIWQSVKDILTTPIGTRVMRRLYGAEIANLVDQPHNGVTRLRVMSAAVAALVRWEPRIEIKSVSFEVDSDGVPTIEVESERVDGARRTDMGTMVVPLREGSV